MLEEAITYGALQTVKIENMRNQHSEILEEAHEAHQDDGERKIAAPEKKYGFVSVCAGDGLAEVFRDLGVDGVISGGQTMNPSTEDILREIDRTPAEIVFVLPNNKISSWPRSSACPWLRGKRSSFCPARRFPRASPPCSA